MALAFSPALIPQVSTGAMLPRQHVSGLPPAKLTNPLLPSAWLSMESLKPEFSKLSCVSAASSSHTGSRSRFAALAEINRSTFLAHKSLPLAQKPNLAGNTRFPALLARAASDDGAKEVYSGVYGLWTVEDSDRLEVLAYRAGLVTAAGSFLLAASTAFLPAGSPVEAAIASSLDGLYALGAGGLGLALVLIHIYVTPIKRTLQLLWLVGALGSLGTAVNFAGPAGKGLVDFVVDSPGGVWAVGPLFAALTGLVFKEGLCYGKLEAAALFFVIPTLLLGHLSGAMDVEVEKGVLLLWAALFTLFAARKFSQPIKDDIGDKSVFIFQALPPKQQEALIAKINGVTGSDSDTV